MSNFRVCFDCQWIFDLDVVDRCPACGGENHDGAREVLGTTYYNLKKSQKLWYERQLLAYGHKLRKKLAELQRNDPADEPPAVEKPKTRKRMAADDD